MKFLITMPKMTEPQLKKAWGGVTNASSGSGLKMERAFVNYGEGRAVCVWSAPSRKELVNVFDKAKAKFESIMEVEEQAPGEFA